MALIKCPACGKEISENANSCPNCGEPIAAKLNAQIDSGAESFMVTGGNRFELSAKTQAEIDYRTKRLSSEGKTVVNVKVSEPQAITAGFTYWKNDVTLLWNASMGNDQYKEGLYNSATSLKNQGKYEQAKSVFVKIGGYKDSKILADQCDEGKKFADKLYEQEAPERARKKRNGWLTILVGAIIEAVIFIVVATTDSGSFTNEMGGTVAFFLIVGFIVIAIGVIIVCYKKKY